MFGCLSFHLRADAMPTTYPSHSPHKYTNLLTPACFSRDTRTPRNGHSEVSAISKQGLLQPRPITAVLRLEALGPLLNTPAVVFPFLHDIDFLQSVLAYICHPQLSSLL